MTVKSFGTFEKNGDLRVATSPTHAVTLRYTGWRELAPEDIPGTPPPRSGAGSSKEAWAGYAESKGVDVDDATSRDEIIEALIAQNVPVE